MAKFEHVKFRGTFRSYQQKVLDNADRYLSDGKINVVAAPGSGKTILGLELIRRLGEACLILSPTTAIREQWGERFREMFLEGDEQYEDLFSNNLHHLKLVNSITYQALYSAMEKVALTEEEEVDCSDIELVQVIRKNKIKTICLDEAHHLKNEWQKSLEKFIDLVGSEVKMITLTATPPYDAESSEWNRYYKLCGDIDEEIFVPELVAQETLCPHQDYVYFNYPTKEETATYKEYAKNVDKALLQISELKFWTETRDYLCEKKNWDCLYEYPKEYIAVMIFWDQFDVRVGKKIIKMLTGKNRLPGWKLSYGERALNFLISKDCKVLSEEQQQEILGILKKYGLYERRKVSLFLNEALKRSLIASVGKLDSIKRITEQEWEAMGDKLRMLVLTDYIKKEEAGKIGTQETFHSINIVSIFESIRRTGTKAKLGVLSGTLIILPACIDLSDVKHKRQEIPGTEYCLVDISGSLHEAVRYVGQLFEQGELQILIGTKSLLGEGWDAPCINSLILASFVGSFVLSNQMRGRAIRIDRNHPDKVSNIWHLVTVEPEHLITGGFLERNGILGGENPNILVSNDYEVLVRRFDCFMGPNYSTGKIESGIDRLTSIKAPYGKEGIDRINAEMLAESRQREKLCRNWKQQLADGQCKVVMQGELEKEHRIPVKAVINWSGLLIFSVLVFAFRWFGMAAVGELFGQETAGRVAGVFLFVLIFFLGKGCLRLYLHRSPVATFRTLGKAVYEAMRECGILAESAGVHVEDLGEVGFAMQLRNASVHDQNIFNEAIGELFSPIENPRYLIIKTNTWGGYNYRYSFACPTVLGKNKECAEVLRKRLKRCLGNVAMVYTRQQEGRRLIILCRKKSYLTKNERLNTTRRKKYVVSRYE